MAGSAAEFRRLTPEKPRLRHRIRRGRLCRRPRYLRVGPGRAFGLLAPAVLLLAFASGVRTCLALAGGALMRGRPARLRRRATLRIAGRCARGRLRSRAPGTRVRAALLIHHRPFGRRATTAVTHRRALRLRRPVRLRAAGTVTHRRALCLRRPVRLRAAGTVTHRRALRLRRPVVAVHRRDVRWARWMRCASCGRTARGDDAAP